MNEYDEIITATELTTSRFMTEATEQTLTDEHCKILLKAEENLKKKSYFLKTRSYTFLRAVF